MHNQGIALKVVFYAEESGKEPVKDWLYCLDKQERRVVGYDIKRVQIGWPLGMPLVKSLGQGLWEVRSTLETKIVRVIFFLQAGRMILLHGFIKKSQKTPANDIETARKRMQKCKGG